MLLLLLPGSTPCFLVPTNTIVGGHLVAQVVFNSNSSFLVLMSAIVIALALVRPRAWSLVPTSLFFSFVVVGFNSVF